jgi:hypothetical protein
MEGFLVHTHSHLIIGLYDKQGAHCILSLRARKTQGGKTACKVAATLILFLGFTFWSHSLTWRAGRCDCQGT